MAARSTGRQVVVIAAAFVAANLARKVITVAWTRITGDEPPIEHLSGRRVSETAHVLHESRQFGEFLRNDGLRDKSALAAADRDQAARNQALNCRANGGPADREPLDQLVLGR